jgi:hypothetical protein
LALPRQGCVKKKKKKKKNIREHIDEELQAQIKMGVEA